MIQSLLILYDYVSVALMVNISNVCNLILCNHNCSCLENIYSQGEGSCSLCNVPWGYSKWMSSAKKINPRCRFLINNHGVYVYQSTHFHDRTFFVHYNIIMHLQHLFLSFSFFFLTSITTFVFWPFMASKTFFIVGCKRTFITIMQYTLMFCWNVFFQSVLACIPTITLFTVEPNVLMYCSNMNL